MWKYKLKIRVRNSMVRSRTLKLEHYLQKRLRIRRFYYLRYFYILLTFTEERLDMNFRNKSNLKNGFKKIHDENYGVTDYYNEAVVEEIEGRESINGTRTPTSYSSAATSDNPRFDIIDLKMLCI